MSRNRRGIIIDWGGVRTSPLPETIAAWLEQERIDRAAYHEGARSPVHALERGEVDPAEFERMLAARLRLVDGGPVPAEGLIARMFAGFEPVEEMYAALRAARSQGIRTCLLSNSWGNVY